MALTQSGCISTEAAHSVGKTLESGQTFLWRNADSEMFAGEEGGEYVTTRLVDGEVAAIRVTDTSDGVVWKSNTPAAEPIVRRSLGLDDELDTIIDTITDHDDNGLVTDAVETQDGLRVPNEPVFPTLISFICSTQMRISRIHQMIQSLCREYGSSLTIDGHTYHAFPTPAQLQTVTEQQLREQKLGYRAEYVCRTVEMIHDGQIQLDAVGSEPRTQARSRLKRCVGVGDKVADCVLLFGGHYLNTVPVDTWIQTAVEDHYPSCRGDSTRQMADQLEDYFGDYAGYAQAYIFHHLRMTTEN